MDTLAEMGLNFGQAGRDNNPIALGTCQRFATLLANNPSASVIGMEKSTDDKGLDIIIGLHGSKSTPDACIRTNTEVLTGAFDWVKIRAQPQLEQMQKIVDHVNALTRSPMPYVYPHGQLAKTR